MSKARITASDWLLAETVRLHEEHHGRSAEDETANVLARGLDADLVTRLARRAGAMPQATDIRTDLARLRRLAARLALAVLVLAALAGALAALSSTSDREISFLWAAASLLALPTLMLLVWVALMLSTRPTRAAASLSGGLLAFGLTRLGPRLLRGPLASETVAAGSGLLGTAAGRWALGVLAHSFWVVYSLSALLVLAVLFSVAQFDLSWGTTLLSDDAVVRLISALAWAPAALGLIEAPDAAWILAGREGQQPGLARAEWAGFLLALVLVYGLLPRLLLVAVSALLAVVGLKRLRLDTRQPGYLRLAGLLSDSSDIDIHGQAPLPASRERRRRPSRTDGPPLLVGMELERSEWPVRLPGLSLQVLGRADTRAQRRQLLAAADGFLTPPPALIAHCSALRTPDEGTGRFLSRLADVAETVPILWLDESGSLAARGISVADRIADWRALADRIGAAIVVLDSEQPDAGALAELQTLLAPAT
ncbi:MAG: DUF2868 domain-containing protein [Wenzhouxiangella sp.]